MMKSGFGTRYFGLPTPKFYRILGDAIVAATGTTTIGSLLAAIPNVDDPHVVKLCLYVGLGSTAVTMIGSFLFRFFGEIEKEQELNN